jgi:tetrahydromethanopterin S-methyltransferase subunit G
MTPQVFMLISTPMIGLLYGLVLGLLAWAASRLVH